MRPRFPVTSVLAFKPCYQILLRYNRFFYILVCFSPAAGVPESSSGCGRPSNTFASSPIRRARYVSLSPPLRKPDLHINAARAISLYQLNFIISYKFQLATSFLRRLTILNMFLSLGFLEFRLFKITGRRARTLHLSLQTMRWWSFP